MEKNGEERRVKEEERNGEERKAEQTREARGEGRRG